MPISSPVEDEAKNNKSFDENLMVKQLSVDLDSNPEVNNEQEKEDSIKLDEESSCKLGSTSDNAELEKIDTDKIEINLSPKHKFSEKMKSELILPIIVLTFNCI